MFKLDNRFRQTSRPSERRTQIAAVFNGVRREPNRLFEPGNRLGESALQHEFTPEVVECFEVRGLEPDRFFVVPDRVIAAADPAQGIAQIVVHFPESGPELQCALENGNRRLGFTDRDERATEIIVDRSIVRPEL